VKIVSPIYAKTVLCDVHLRNYLMFTMKTNQKCM